MKHINQMTDQTFQDKEVLENTPKKQADGKDYVVRRKIIWKGQTAPRNCVYIVIYVTAEKSKYTAVQLIIGRQGDEYEAKIAEALRESVRKKYDV